MKNKQNLNINVDDLRDITCSCGCAFFSQLMRIKHVSPIQSPDGKGGVLHMSGLVCVECGKSDTEALQNFERKLKEEFDSKIIPIGRVN